MVSGVCGSSCVWVSLLEVSLGRVRYVLLCASARSLPIGSVALFSVWASVCEFWLCPAADVSAHLPITHSATGLP